MAFNVGDTLIWQTGSKFRGDISVTVTRVGRKYAYVARPGGIEVSERFDRSTGIEDSQSSRGRIVTESTLAEDAACSEIVRKLREAGVDLRYSLSAGLGFEELTTMLSMVQRPRG